MNETAQPAASLASPLLERLNALEAEARRQASIMSALQRSHEVLLQRYYSLALRVDRLQRRLDRFVAGAHE